MGTNGYELRTVAFCFLTVQVFGEFLFFALLLLSLVRFRSSIENMCILV